MSVVEELIRIEQDGALSFGNHLEKAKKKVKDFEVKGDIYSLKTHNEVTRLEKNESLLFEAVPGATVFNFAMSEGKTAFSLCGIEDTQITLELEPSVTYGVSVGGETLGSVKTTMSGKLVFSAELGEAPVCVEIVRQ